MSSPNDYTYMNEFAGNLRAESEPVPVQVKTTLRIATDATGRDLQKYKSRAYDAAPQYVFGGGNLPLHPSLQAQGRHDFTW